MTAAKANETPLDLGLKTAYDELFMDDQRTSVKKYGLWPLPTSSTSGLRQKGSLPNIARLMDRSQPFWVRTQ